MRKHDGIKSNIKKVIFFNIFFMRLIEKKYKYFNEQLIFEEKCKNSLRYLCEQYVFIVYSM